MNALGCAQLSGKQPILKKTYLKWICFFLSLQEGADCWGLLEKGWEPGKKRKNSPKYFSDCVLFYLYDFHVADYLNPILSIVFFLSTSTKRCVSLEFLGGHEAMRSLKRALALKLQLQGELTWKVISILMSASNICLLSNVALYVKKMMCLTAYYCY